MILGEFFFSGKDDWTYVWVGVLVLWVLERPKVSLRDSSAVRSLLLILLLLR